MDEWNWELFGAIVSIVAAPLTLFGLWVTWRNARKSKTAAEAARDSATDTTLRIRQISSSVELTKLKAFAHEVITQMRNKQWTAAAMRALDLAEGISGARKAAHNRDLAEEQEWQLMVTKARYAQEVLEKRVRRELGGDEERALADCRRGVFDVLNLMSGLAVMATESGAK